MQLGLCKTYQRCLSCSYKGHLSLKNLNTFGSETLSKSIINRKLIYLFEFSYSNRLYYVVEGRNVHICFEEFETLIWLFSWGWGTKLGIHDRNEVVRVHYTVIVLFEVRKICFFNWEILETTFSAIYCPERASSNVQPR